ncbi:hypothetical protein MKQ68_17005 [Chitinophaga horti]|uniref:Uncharacterized protein n=1 Tax=Chitinophaga horti TaxID=2920382 RepID=A0ABY6IWM9_9BACT|nr:hypothetical protein [Chitinophaga horti]UYQ91788.1 hypothetical protein MKQ68_17005 [Chitinophaga horti]
MPKSKDFPLNRRLKKGEVKAFIESGGAKLHREYTFDFYEKYRNGTEKRDEVYELPNGDFIYVFDPASQSVPGKGNYWQKDAFLRFVSWKKRVDEDYKHGRAASVDHWRHYTRLGNRLIEAGDSLLTVISTELDIPAELDYGYESLALIDNAIINYDLSRAWEVLYDALVFYIGQIIVERISGAWDINVKNYGGDYPYVTIPGTGEYYMPINIVRSELDGVKGSNLRKATSDEIRIHAFKQL